MDIVLTVIVRVQPNEVPNSDMELLLNATSGEGAEIIEVSRFKA